jgi:DNA (cytosine-5)-methyltransferase 1
MTAYYNENDPKAAAWLRELIKGDHIALGDVDERSIEDVVPTDLCGYTQCHFFAGVGGWSYALRLAGWPDNKAVWTGSCPCQPFSTAGKGKGFADERHLWPAWFYLICSVKPPVVFGEQVASAMHWIDLVSRDLEEEKYALGFAVLGAHSVGAPHIRQRLYWVAESQSEQSHRGGDSGRGRRELATSRLGDSNESRSQGWGDAGSGRDNQRSPWAASDFIECRDGKRRPVEPGIFPLAHGVPGRVGLLRGYGNAIVPQVAATFIEACMT